MKSVPCLWKISLENRYFGLMTRFWVLLKALIYPIWPISLKATWIIEFPLRDIGSWFAFILPIALNKQSKDKLSSRPGQISSSCLINFVSVPWSWQILDMFSIRNIHLVHSNCSILITYTTFSIPIKVWEGKPNCFRANWD